jgi:hypothetical protein
MVYNFFFCFFSHFIKQVVCISLELKEAKKMFASEVRLLHHKEREKSKQEEEGTHISDR